MTLDHVSLGPERQTAPAGAVASVVDLKIHFDSKAGRVHAVDGVDFDIRDGETLGLVGETGCGKTVTARSFLRLIPMPPGIHAGGAVYFRPHQPCSHCAGEGCAQCGNSGRLPIDCQRCRGEGCPACDGTGSETIDLSTIPERDLREIRGNRIAMIFQDPAKSLNPALTVRDQIAEVFYQHRTNELLERAGLGSSVNPLLRRHVTQRSRLIERLLLAMPPHRSRRDRIERVVDDMVAAALAETQIPNPPKVMERYPHELSGGMKQRVMIAQALACNPDLLIADEPTTALDVTVQARIMELIKNLQNRHKSAVLYISHDLSLVRRVCDRVAVMYAGRIVEIGRTEEIFADPLHPYTRGLLAAIPSRTHDRGHLVAIKGTVPELIEPPPSCRFVERCSFAVEICAAMDPELTPAPDEHGVACFIHHRPDFVGTAPSFAERTS
ncbi:MAG TPA: ABC transporter ATP-binding protein [Acidimicrobiia bacterium]